MKLWVKIRRRRSGSFQAIVLSLSGEILFICHHEHSYGTSNSCYKDSASKCAHQAVKRIREEEASGAEGWQGAQACKASA